jgi:aspartyl/asparaginyl beta-hydroxylase (cupin superfamily)
MDLTWRELNPDKLDAVLTDTVAYQNFPVTRTVVDRVPGKKDRVRFMALAKKGRIVRHADNHDPALIRLHVPIITNPTVLFAVWDNSNRQVTRKFPEAALCYFNMRQPHAVQNGRDEPRIHLVIDVYSNPELLQLLSPYSHEPLARRPESRTRQALSHRERGRR